MEETQFILALCGIITSLFLHINLQFLQKINSYIICMIFFENIHIMIYSMLNVVRHISIMFKLVCVCESGLKYIFHCGMKFHFFLAHLRTKCS